MNSWKLRLILIGFINLVIGIAFGATRGYSELIIGYVAVALLVALAGVVRNPKEEVESS
jgi:uncharacterized membrane protein HdeD (DUF308 family)